MNKTVKRLIDYLHKHDRLYYVWNFFRQFPNKEYFKDSNPAKRRHAFLFCTYGDMNKDVPLYLIKFDTWIGLMGILLHTSVQLAVADFFGFSPVIEWRNLLYQRDNADIGGDNIFEYYFEQPCGISVDDAMNSYCVATVDECTKNSLIPFDLNFRRQFWDNRIMYTGAINKFIRLNTATKTHVSKAVFTVTEGYNTLGIHIRGGGYQQFKMKAHPKPVSISDYIAEARRAVEEHEFDRIFLATDADDVLEAFVNEFGSMVVYHNDVARIPSGTASDWAFIARDERDSRVDHGYKMGLEVITDVWTLARCNGFIGSMSMVSKAAACINGSEYCFIKIIDNGLYGINDKGDIDPDYIAAEGDKMLKEFSECYNKLKNREKSL